jgi:signal transduction histidine kinase
VSVRRASLRLRLTLSYGLLFFIIGLVMLAGTYLLVQQYVLLTQSGFSSWVVAELGYSQEYLKSPMPNGSGGTIPVGTLVNDVVKQTLVAAPHVLGLPTLVALTIATLFSVAAGWWIAGRMLRPLREITTIAKRLSASTLHERISLQGPHDELRDLADTFDAMLGRLEAAFTAQRDFVADASHELRTPLAIMRTELDVTLEDAELDLEELRRMATTIRDAIARSEDVIDRLLLLAESEDLAEREPVDLGDLVRSTAGQHERRARERGLTLRLDLEPAVVMGEAALLERLVDNLISNAVQYAPEDSTVAVNIRHDDGWTTLSVANGGEVISQTELPRLFERFYRRERSRSRRAGGSGLGLAIVAAIAKAHGGSVAAEALATGGLTVTVRLPSAQSADADI